MEFSAHSRRDSVQSRAFSVYAHVEVSHLSGMSDENPSDLSIFQVRHPQHSPRYKFLRTAQLGRKHH